MIATRHLHADADTIQIRIARVIDLSRDDVLSIDLAPDDAIALSSAIRTTVDALRNAQHHGHPAES